MRRPSTFINYLLLGDEVDSGGWSCNDGHANDAPTRYCTTCGVARESAGDGAREAPESLRGASNLTGRVHRRRNSMIAIGVSCVVLAAIAAVAYFTMTRPVPSVQGASRASATATLTATGFKVSSGKDEFSNSVPKAMVVKQDPPAGSRARQGSTVAVVLSRGPAVTIPDVTGRESTSATEMLTSSGVKAVSTDTASETVPEGHVISSAPQAGSQVEKGSSVSVSVSSGPALMTVTAVVHLDKAMESLELTSCDEAVLYFSIYYNDSVLENTEGAKQPLTGPWAKATGTRSCALHGEFAEVPTAAERFRLDLEPETGKTKYLAWKTRQAMVADEWSYESNS